MSDIFKFISRLINSGSNDKEYGVTPVKPQQKPAQNSSINNRWDKPYRPLRRIVLWGWDDNNNPSFLVLYGRHDFIKPKLLSSNLKYTSYAIFRGKAGHLPSSQAVKIIQEEDKIPEMYYKKGLSYDWGWRKNTEYKFKDFFNLKPEHQPVFSYFPPQLHNECISKIEERGIHIPGFRFAKNPNEILNLDESNVHYLNHIIEMTCNQSIYKRKKLMDELIAKNPSVEVYRALLNTGSTEVISGLFLALAKAENPVLLEEARLMAESEIVWADENYVKGIKRCANLYINSLNPDFRDKRIDWIRSSLSKMDLNLIRLEGKIIPSDKPIEGATYRKYAINGILRDIIGEYDYSKRRYVYNEAPIRYEQGPYNDGRKLKLIDFKNTIQESEIYGLADVMGKVAYYLDAPRLTYYLKGSGKYKAMKYFHRLVRRIMDSYAVLNEEKFMEAMKHLLTSYTKNDYVCKYKGNFQYNEFIKYYLYNDFSGKPPDNISWSARYKWITTDNLIMLEGRHEFKKEIWDRHLDVVAEIAVLSQIDQITKACYFIMKNSPNLNKFVENIKYEQLVNLTLVSYKPLAQMFQGILKNRIDKADTFDPDLMLALIGCPDENLQKSAMSYFERTNGLFSPQIIVDMLFLKNIDRWTDLFRQNLLLLEGDRYGEFIKHFIKRSGEMAEFIITLPADIPDILTLSSEKTQGISASVKVEIMNSIISVLSNRTKLQDWILSFLEEIIFSIPFEELKTILEKVDKDSIRKSGSQRNKRIITVLESVRTVEILSDSHLIDILESGTSKMIKTLVTIIENNKSNLKNCFSSLLIMFETDVTALNQIAEEIFDSLPQNDQKKLHAIIIDSPVKNAYSMGLKKLESIYGEMIPGEFVIQMLEHASPDVKAYISNKIDGVFDNPGNGNSELFMYYIKTLLLTPNRNSKSKDRVYAVLPGFVHLNQDKSLDIESMLIDIGGSNIIKDSERALVTLAKIRKDGTLNAG